MLAAYTIVNASSVGFAAQTLVPLAPPGSLTALGELMMLNRSYRFAYSEQQRDQLLAEAKTFEGEE